MDWKQIVKNVAPAIGTALGGPMGGIATKFLADNLLGNPDASEQDVADYVGAASPDTLLKIKQLDKDFAVKMRELDIDLEKINQQDRDSARGMAVKTSLIPQMALSVIFISGFVLVLYGVFNGVVQLDDSSQKLAFMLIGILSAGVTQIMNFFFGSSAGSKEKTAKLYAPKS